MKIVKRRLFKIGQSCAITLPMIWLRSKEIQDGKMPEEVAIEIQDNLTISTIKEKNVRSRCTEK